MTGRDLITGSLRLLGAVASGESLGAAEATDGLSALNDMIDGWSTEQLLIPNKVREVFALVAGQESYTMGSGGNFNTARPQKIENALIQIAGTDPVLEIPVRILNQDQYAGLMIKTVQSTYPTDLYSDGAYPLTSISVWPVPNSSCSLVLYSWKPLSQLALDTVISLPPGYARALRYCLAVELAPEYGKQAPTEVVEIAGTAKGAIKRMNTRSEYLDLDSSLMGRRRGFNWFTGGPR